MASLLAVCLLGVFAYSVETAAQVINVTLQVNNSTEAIEAELPPGGLPEVIVDSLQVENSTKEVAAELPPGGLPEVIVDPEAASSTSKVPVQFAPRLFATAVNSNPQLAPKQIKEDGELKTVIAVDPDAVKGNIVGTSCTDAKDCLSVNNTSCINGVCDCVSGFIQSKHSLKKCIKVPSGLEDSCEEEAQCAYVVAASECRGGVCLCPPNYVYDIGRCWELQLLGGVCNTSVQCENIALSICTQNVCACQPPLIPSPNSNKCLMNAGTLYRAACEEDIQCTDSYGDEAHCSNSQCICTNNYHFNATTCVPDKKLGDSCEADEDCAISDVNNIEGSRACVSHVCDCAPGFTYLQGEDICTVSSSAEELAVSFTWVICIVIAKYYLS